MITSITPQFDGTYLARFNDDVRLWQNRKQARNWLKRCKEKAAAQVEPRTCFINPHAIRTFREVAAIMKMSTRHVQELESIAMRKMRKLLREDGTFEEVFER